MKRIKHYRQKSKNDCGIACLRTIFEYHGLSVDINWIRSFFSISKEGVSIQNISEFLSEISVEHNTRSSTIESLGNFGLPSILLWNQNHYVVLYKIVNNQFFIVDPAIGKRKVEHKEFEKKWLVSSNKGIAIEIGQVPNDIKDTSNLNDSNLNKVKKLTIFSLFKHLNTHKRALFIVGCFLILGSIIQLIIPFLTQSIVDRGINNSDIDFIYLVLLCQIMLFAGSLTMGFVRDWIMLHIGIRISVDLSNSYVESILRKTTYFFDNRRDGDFLQRLFDNLRVESFLTRNSLSFVIAILNLMVFGVVLMIYSWQIFAIFLISTIAMIIWIVFFLQRRRTIDNERFAIAAESRNKFLEIIHGIEEIKLNSLQKTKQADWLEEQMNLLRIRLKLLLIGQYQRSGAQSINQLKNVILTFLSATYVISGHMSLGSMLAIQYLIGQLSQPVADIISFIQTSQDAQLSLERLAEVYEGENQPSGNIKLASNYNDLHIRNLNVTIDNNHILSNINLEIPYGKYVAIVGESGCGKTTLLKTLCQFIKPSTGSIQIGEYDLSSVDNDSWMKNVSTVAQEGFVFSDTIKYNITLSLDDAIDSQRLKESITLSYLGYLLKSLPLGVQTKIGKGGKKLSKGQKQRILIARAIYKNGSYLFIDEASSALDNISESKVLRNLKLHFHGRTVISVAHKLETIKDADYIVHMINGEITEVGSHDDLSKRKGDYYKLFTGNKV